jgi:FAD/FMN-containing dehydrogenase
VSILIELGATAPALCAPGPDGTVPLARTLEQVLAGFLEQGLISDAVIATSEAQRRAMWARREAAAEITYARKPAIDTDIALPVLAVDAALAQIHARLPALDPGAETLAVAHLGDGNVHFTVFPTDGSAAMYDRVVEMIEDVVQGLRGSFSAEHGVGLSKRASMARRKNPVAIEVMRALKAALDPDRRMNPGKVIPD